VKHDPTSALGTMVYPHSHPCKSLKYGQLGFQLAVSYQAGTVDSRADRNEQDNKSEAYQGYRKKMVWKTTEDLEWIRGP
jgi:predicted acetyltransferase